MTKRLQIVIDAVRECAEAGMTASEAAESIGLSTVTIRSIAKDVGFKFRNANYGRGIPSERNEQIAERFDAGETLESISKDFGITRERVRQIAKRMGRTPRQEERQAFLDQIVATAKTEWLTCRELAERFGVKPNVVLQATGNAGIKLPKRTLEQETELSAMAARVAAGESIYSVCGRDHAIEGRLHTYLKSVGIKSRRGKWRDFSHRYDIIRDGRASGEAWHEIAAKLSPIEGFVVSGGSLATWACNNFDCLPPLVRKPRPVFERRPYRTPSQRVVAAEPQLDVIVKDTVRDTALANRGRVPASRIAAAIGVSRNSIIGHWNRARAAGVIA